MWLKKIKKKKKREISIIVQLYLGELVLYVGVESGERER